MAAERRLRVLIVDDEPLAAQRLQMLCADLAGVGVVGTSIDGAEALALAEALSPDVLLLDISMPGLDGMTLARTLGAMQTRPAVIFCTAHPEFAIEAFDVAAVDYLLKPVAPDRLERALSRVSTPPGEASRPQAASPWLEELWVPHRSELIRIPVDSLDWIGAERDYVALHVGAQTYLMHHTISALEARLDPAQFLRVHRSAIVRRAAVATLRHDGLGAWSVVLTRGEELRIGRSFLAEAKQIAAR